MAVGGAATYGGEVYGGHLAANAANNHTVDWWRFDAFAEYELTKNVEIEVYRAQPDAMSSTTMPSIRRPRHADLDTFAFVAPGRAGYVTVKWKYD